MKAWIAVAAVAASTWALPANAVETSSGPVNSGPVDVTSSYAPGYTLIDFNNGISPFVGGGVRSGTVTDEYVAPFGDETPYFSVGPSTGSIASLTLSGINQLSFYWGSLDTYNTITFEGLGQSFSGTAFGGTNDPVSRPSRQVTFRFSASEAANLTGITIRSSTNAFELDNLIFGSAVPEPTTWAMLLVGFGLIGSALRRTRKSLAPALFAA